jgi:hypothetical protein
MYQSLDANSHFLAQFKVAYEQLMEDNVPL